MNYKNHTIESALQAVKNAPKSGENCINEVLFFGVGGVYVANDIIKKMGLEPNPNSAHTHVDMGAVKKILKFLLEEDEALIEYEN